MPNLSCSSRIMLSDSERLPRSTSSPSKLGPGTRSIASPRRSINDAKRWKPSVLFPEIMTAVVCLWRRARIELRSARLPLAANRLQSRTSCEPEGCHGDRATDSLLPLPQHRQQISHCMNDVNHLQRFYLWIIYDPVISIGLHKPEAQRPGRQVFANMARERSIRQEATSSLDRLFNAIGCFQIVACHVAPDFKEVVYSLGRELVTAHAWRFSASQVRFLSVSLE